VNETIDVVIADDHPLFRRGLTEVLEGDPSFRVIADAGDGDTALALVRRHRPDVVLLDIAMPGTSGLAVAEAIRNEKLDTEIVILTMYKDGGLFQRALDLGVKGYVLKDSAAVEIVACVHTVATGRAYISPALSDELLEHRARRTTPELAALDELTPAETRVLRFIARGLTTADIARRLGNSPKTIENHRTHICRKLGLNGPQAALRFALEHKALLE
jgi:DNA-binding NarL/FixJ family response regulator